MTTKAEKDDQADNAREAHYRAIALQHARSLEERKKLQIKVLDTIIVAFDLPTDQTTTSAHPSSSDAAAFRDCLILFRPEDLDEVVSERNIDNRCGYALCRNATKQAKVTRKYDATSGKIVEEKLGSWCSTICKERTNYVRRQLSAEPAWLRVGHGNHIRLQTDIEEMQEEEAGNDQANQEALALERGDPKQSIVENISIFEKATTMAPKPPKQDPQITVGDVLEGLPIRSIGNRKDLT